MTDAELKDMSLKELQALKGAIHSAIISAIARDRIERESKTGGSKTGGVQVAEVVTIDLERERDAWMSSRR